MSTAPEDGVYKRTCPLCEAMCGLLVTVADGTVGKIRPNPDDVWSAFQLRGDDSRPLSEATIFALGANGTYALFGVISVVATVLS